MEANLILDQNTEFLPKNWMIHLPTITRFPTGAIHTSDSKRKLLHTYLQGAIDLEHLQSLAHALVYLCITVVAHELPAPESTIPPPQPLMYHQYTYTDLGLYATYPPSEHAMTIQSLQAFTD
jgi:hypothetical protein